MFLGDGALMTDNVVFDPKKTPEARAPAVGLPGSPDDRWVFTEENPRRELLTAASLAAASRALKGYNDDLAARSLKAAIAIYDRATPQEPLARVGAATELLHRDEGSEVPPVAAGPARCHRRRISNASAGWWAARCRSSRTRRTRKAIRDAVAAYRVKVDALAKETPYGVPYKPDIWGAGWNIQRFGWDQWMLHLSFPDLFPRTYALQALSFILGVHPGSNTASFVSGVGAKSLTTAYGFNRADWSHIPGGSASGTALIRPDFPELKTWPFFWQQTEYVLGRGTTDYLLLVLAADHVLNQ